MRTWSRGRERKGTPTRDCEGGNTQLRLNPDSEGGTSCWGEGGLRLEVKAHRGGLGEQEVISAEAGFGR